MNQAMLSIDEIFKATLLDNVLSLSEQKTLEETLRSRKPAAKDIALLKSTMFKSAKAKLNANNGPAVLDWLEGIVRVIDQYESTLSGSTASAATESHFSPGEECLNAILQFINSAKMSLDICVFTISDDRIARAIGDALRRGIKIRVITDNDKLLDKGSDILEFVDKNIPVKVDYTDYHMHHKYALADGKRLLTGSYNWTRSAAMYNEENLIVTADSQAVKEFTANFEGLWKTLQPFKG